MSNYPKYIILKNKENQEDHVGEISEFKEGKFIKLKLTDTTKNKSFHRGVELEVILPKNNKIYIFDAFILYFDIIERILTIDYPENIRRLKRRKHKRYKIPIPIMVELEDELANTYTYDISVEGISFLVSPSIMFKSNSIIPVSFDLNENTLHVNLQLVNSRILYLNQKKFLLLGASFETLSTNDYNNLLNYISKFKK